MTINKKLRLKQFPSDVLSLKQSRNVERQIKNGFFFLSEAL